MDLLRHACAVLAGAASGVLKKAAVEALLSAWRDGLDLPTNAPRLIWSFWASSPAERSWRYGSVLGDIPDAHVRAEAIGLLDRDDTGGDLHDLALDVLGGKAHAAHVDDRVLLGFVDRAHTVARVEGAARLIEAVHAARALDTSVLLMIRDRWAASALPGVREQAIVVSAELGEAEPAFVAKMLNDADVEVRIAMAYQLDSEFPGREHVWKVVEDRLLVEQHPRGRAALHRALASIIEDVELQ